MDPDSNDEGDNLGIDFTGFMFGNIDSEGRLENDIFDTAAKRQLTSLTQFGLGSLIRDFIPAGEEVDEDSSDTDDPEQSFEKKADDAVDYSDITELAEDLVVPEAALPSVANNESDDIESILPAVKLFVEPATDRNPETVVAKNDQDLMPPPLIFPSKITPGDPNGSSPVSGVKEEALDKNKKLDTPLAAILPSKYANVDVRELFPDFRPDKVLHFSRLFGPGKPSSLPQIWRSVKNRRKKRKSSITTEIKTDTQSDSTSDTEETKPFQGWEFNYGPEPTPDMCVSDDEEKFLRDGPEETEDTSNDQDDKKPKVADWRYGPAQVWYDLLNVSESGEGFNYGFKLKEEKPEKIREETEAEIKGEPIPDDAYLMVTQLHWEDDVVWDGNDIKHSVQQKLNSKTWGWLPSGASRTPGGQAGKATSTPAPVTKTITTASGKIIKSLMKGQQKPEEKEEEPWYSIFPIENEELVYSKWEDDIIWDPEAMDKIPKPKVLTLDPNDENIILGIPDDLDPSKQNRNVGPQPKVKIPHPHVKKSKILLGKAGVINVLAEDAPPPPPKSPDRDPYNISNDIFYMAKTTESTLRLKVGGNNLIQHSTPVMELRAPFIPTHMCATKLRTFHRPPLRKYSHGALAAPISYPVLPLLKHIRKKAKQRELERMASGGGDVFFMRSPEDLTGRDGDIVLLEFCEEHPPFMNQVGMCSKIKNYYKRKAAKDSTAPTYTYGETTYAHTSPFLGILQPGTCVQTVENAMYRAPIYNHNVPGTDFLVIRTRNNYFIREANGLFTVGQECPLFEVFGPNSKRSNNFVRDFLQVFIYRLFWKSTENPRKIRMDHIKNAFPSHSESSIRKRLKQCADFKRTGMNSNWWVIKPEFRLPTEEEIRAMVSPEQCCAYYSMIAALQRLKDAGYGEKFIFAPQDDDDEEQQLKMDDEIKVAPWNTTRAYIQAVRGKCLLQLTGPADPTGCGEGFSYVRMPNKPMQPKEEQETQPKRSVTGTDADLRRLSLSNAKALLRKFQVPEEEIKKLSRWEVIDVVRTLSTEKAKAGEEGMDKFSRGNRFSIAEHQERYKEECQRIFDLQNKVLASSEVLSTDEGESTASEESDLEEMGKNLENMLANKKTSIQLSLEREEQERQELLKKIMDEEQDGSGKAKKKDDDPNSSLSQGHAGRVLKITRTFKNPDGRVYSRTEIVRRQPVIDAYVKIRTTKDETFIKSFATIDEAQKEEMKKERRRIQEQLRRIKRNQMRGSGDRMFSSSGGGGGGRDGGSGSSSRRKPKLKPDLKLKCGACGEVGHMRTNKACPLYTGCDRLPSTPSNNNSVTEGQEEDYEREMYEDEDEEDLVNVEGTKVKLNSKLLKRHEEWKRQKELDMKYSKDQYGRRKRRLGQDNHCDYLENKHKTANRRRTDPVVVMSTILEVILNEMRDMPDVQPFLFPVNAKNVPDYYKIIQRPMDLQTIRENLRQKRYQSREEFLADVNQIVENSSKYNGPKSLLTEVSQRMLQKCIECLSEKEDRLMRLEKAINPLLDDNDQVALSFIFEKLISGKLKTMPESWPFLKPVNKKQVKDYYTLIRKPMDLETVTKKVAAHKYHSRQEFLGDIELIAKNCEQYNGMESNFTAQAKILFEAASKSLMEEFAEHCVHLEKNIAIAQERARNDDDESWAEDDLDGDDMRMSSGDDMFMDTLTPSLPPTPTSKRESLRSFRPEPTRRKGRVQEKRGRGRPRKIRPIEQAPQRPQAKKRGPGRPRKQERNQDSSQNLEEDLQFTTDDEDDDFEEVSDQDHDEATNLLVQGEQINFKQEEDFAAMDDQQGEEDPQIASAAEAMVQLSGFYAQSQDESMDVDVDPNYDPSDFLGNLKQEPRETKPLDINLALYEQPNTSAEGDNVPLIDDKPPAIHDDLAISDSDEEPDSLLILPKTENNSFEGDPQAVASQSTEQNASAEIKSNDDDAGDDLLWF